MRRFLVFISLLIATLTAAAQSLLPTATEPSRRYTIAVTMPRGSLTGIFILHHAITEGGASRIDASIFNEFGVSACDFSFHPLLNQVKLQHITLPGMGALKRRVAKRYVRRGLRSLMDLMMEGQTAYRDEKHQFEITLAPIVEQTDTTTCDY